MRRKEFLETAEPVIREIFRRASHGHLALYDDGYPHALPLNFVVHGGHLYFHGTPHGMLVEQLGQPVSFTAQDMMSWIPSTWRHPRNACPATTFYRSASCQGRLEAVEELPIKATVLEAFMSKYQPEGGHQPIEADDKAYAGPLRALAVARLSLRRAVAKVKMGQNLTADQRHRVLEGLEERARPEDRWVALEMRRLGGDEAAERGSFRWTDDPRQVPLADLTALLKVTYWAKDRETHEIEQHLRDSYLTLGCLDQGKLVAYARLGSPGRKIAYLFDVVVAPPYRGRGLGQELLRKLFSHPRAASLEKILLDTRDAMTLYEKFSFRRLETSTRNGGSTLMLGGKGAGVPTLTSD